MNAAILALIVCTTPQHQSFSVHVGPIAHFLRLGEVHTGSATALHGMNVAIKAEPVVITTLPISTRTLVGESLYFPLPGEADVNLTDITYVPEGFEDKLGISGTITLPSGEQAPLSCTKLGN